MKRSQASSPATEETSHANKKLKMDTAATEPDTQNDEGWTKVEKRKSKKQKRTESKQGVRTRLPPQTVCILTFTYAGCDSQVHVREGRDPEASRGRRHQCTLHKS